MGSTPRVVVTGTRSTSLQQNGGVGEAASLLAQRDQANDVLVLEGQRQPQVEQPLQAARVSLDKRVRQVVDDPSHHEPIVDVGQHFRPQIHTQPPHPGLERLGGLGFGSVEGIKECTGQRVAHEEVTGQADRLQWDARTPGDRQQDDRKRDRHTGPARHDTVEIRIRRVVKVVKIAPEIESIKDENAKSIDGAFFDGVRPRVELGEPLPDVDG